MFNMSNLSRKRERKTLPRSLGQIDLPIPCKLSLCHAEQINLSHGEKMFSPTAANLLQPLLNQSNTSPRGFEFKLKNNDAQNYRYWFIFDRGYRLFEHKDAMDMTREQLLAVPVVTSYPRSIYAGVAAMFMVGNENDLDELMLRSPIFSWLSMIAGGQAPDETWAYYFQPLRK
jgi:hypothetical protein